jgi:hypothetical protein
MQEYCAALAELWNLMDTTNEEKYHFERFTSVVGENVDAVSDTGILSIENIQQVFSHHLLRLFMGTGNLNHLLVSTVFID